MAGQVAESPRRIITVRTKRADGTPAYSAFTPGAVAQRLGLSPLADGDAVAPGITVRFQEDGVDFALAGDDLKDGYRVANDWAIAIRETAQEPIHIQTLAREVPSRRIGAPAKGEAKG